MYTGRGPGREWGQGVGVEWKEAGCWSDPELGTEKPSVPTYLTGDFLMARSGLYPIKSLIRTQVTQKQTSNSSVSGFDSKSP